MGNGIGGNFFRDIVYTCREDRVNRVQQRGTFPQLHFVIFKGEYSGITEEEYAVHEKVPDPVIE